jgi:hypothetical protein
VTIRQKVESLIRSGIWAEDDGALEAIVPADVAARLDGTPDVQPQTRAAIATASA